MLIFQGVSMNLSSVKHGLAFKSDLIAELVPILWSISLSMCGIWMDMDYHNDKRLWSTISHLDTLSSNKNCRNMKLWNIVKFYITCAYDMIYGINKCRYIMYIENTIKIELSLKSLASPEKENMTHFQQCVGIGPFPCNIWTPNIRHPKSHRTLWSSPCFPVFFRGGLLHADTLIQAALLSIIVNHIHHPKAIKGCQVDQPENSKQPMVSWQVGSQNRDHPRGGWQQTWSFQMEMAKKKSLSP